MTRATSEQVEDVLHWTPDDVDAELLEDICRDWLDMQARLEAAQRLYDASTPGLMIGDVLGALEVFRTTMEATDGT
jgi:hypothetical protein